MSYTAMHWAFDQSDLGTTQKFVLVVLGDMADEEHSCFPSQPYVAEKTGCAVRTVRRALEALEEGGYIRRERRATSTGYRTSDRFFLLLDRPSGHFGKRSSATPLPDNDDSLTGQSVLGTTIEPPVEPPVSVNARAIALDIGLSEDDLFEIVWQTYPRHEGKAAARKAYPKAVRAVGDAQTLQGHVEAWSWAALRSMEKRFMPHFSTWLNGERWNDDLPEPPAAPTAGYDSPRDRALAVIRMGEEMAARDEQKGIES